ncbi:hypothetical protein CCP2SC5_240044 [Azospirillaceae bacterium]
MIGEPGDNVFVTPLDHHAYYVLVDDLRIGDDELLARYDACLIQQTSWSSRQAVVKVTRDLDRKALIQRFNVINREIGDPVITGLRHPFRLAGFRNMKPKYLRDDGLRPFVRPTHMANRYCPKLAEEVRSIQPQRALTP